MNHLTWRPMTNCSREAIMTTNAQLESHLKTLHLTAFLEQYHDLAQEAQQTALSYEGFLFTLAEQEVTRRTLNRQRRLIRQARFPIRKELPDFDFSAIPDLNRSRLLALAETAAYIPAAEPVIFVGNPGLGKSHLAISLGLAACRLGYKTRFYNTAALVNELTLAQSEQRLSKLFAAALKHRLIILDELGFIPFSPSGAQLLFQFCSALHEQVAIIVTTNLAFSDWPQVFGDERLTAALIDRLTYHAHIFEFRGQSYRFRDQRQQEVTPDPI
jgi:DNA replication protein DnaC